MNSVHDLIPSLASALYYPFVRHSYSVLVIAVHLGTGVFEHERWFSGSFLWVFSISAFSCVRVSVASQKLFVWCKELAVIQLTPLLIDLSKWRLQKRISS